MDAVHRMCSVKAFAGNQVVLLHITFPGNYPNGNAPSFQFVPGSTVDIVVKTKLLKLLKYTAQQRVLRNRSCLEPCLRQLVIALEKVSQCASMWLTYYNKHLTNVFGKMLFIYAHQLSSFH